MVGMSNTSDAARLVSFNDTAAAYPEQLTIVDLFRRQAASTPLAEALRHHERSLTYRELDEQSDRIAAHIVARGVGKGSLVVILMDHSMELVSAILGTLKAGAAYVPVDTVLPPDRVAFIVQDISGGHPGKRPLVLVQPRFADRLPRNAALVVELDASLTGVDPLLQPLAAPAPRATDAAYVIYTSGSTGVPKGVVVEHRSLVNYITWAHGAYCQGKALTWPLFSSISFDLTVTSIFTPLISGGRLVVYRDQTESNRGAVLQVIEDNLADIVKLTPAHLAMVRNVDLSGSRVRTFIVGGEEFRTELAAGITAAYGHPVALYNEYGPTEATVGCMIHCYDGARDLAASVPIGVPASNAGIFILDEHFQPVATEVPGEMFISGDGLARGYFNRPELTAEKFLEIPDPRCHGGRDLPPLRVYRTGDMARWSADNIIQFMGRRDYQVKVGSMRIELGEIEAQVLGCAGVTESVAIVVRAVSGGSSGAEGPDRLAAYFVCEPEVSAEVVRKHLSAVLPDFMVPTYLIRLERLPLTSSGKVDRAALPVPGPDHSAGSREFVAPVTEVQTRLSAILCSLLAVPQVGVTDDFFELGGTSLLAVRLVSLLRDAFNVSLPMDTLFSTTTIAGLEAAIAAANASKPQSPSQATVPRLARIARLPRISAGTREP